MDESSALKELTCLNVESWLIDDFEVYYLDVYML